VGLFNKKKSDQPQPQQATTQQGGVTVSQSYHVNPDFILGAIDDGVMMVGQDKLIHLFNPAASKITGWNANEAVGLDFHSVLQLINSKGEPLPDEQRPFAKSLATNQIVRANNLLLTTKQGKRVSVSIVVSPVFETPGKPPIGVVGVFRDITQQMAEEAQRSDFISTASHEMRTPVAAIEGYLSLALNTKIAKIDDNARKLLEKAQSATQHLGVLFQDLLTSSRVEDGRLQSYPVVVELGEIAHQVAEAERFHAQEKGLNLRFVLSSDPSTASGGKVIRPLYYVFADPHRLQEVFTNIINNAIKYTPEGSVVVSLTGDASVAQIQVQDTGPGIPADDIGHLFQKFYRVDNSMTRSIGGTGLGLFICRKIVELYNGRIWVESQPGKGSTFFINLPRLTSTQALAIQQRQASTISPLDAR
jgi:two-component system, OmpR family, sensor histidine kinase VicK